MKRDFRRHTVPLWRRHGEDWTISIFFDSPASWRHKVLMHSETLDVGTQKVCNTDG